MHAKLNEGIGRNVGRRRFTARAPALPILVLPLPLSPVRRSPLLFAAVSVMAASPLVAQVPVVPLPAPDPTIYIGHYALADSTGTNSMPLRVYEEEGALLGQLRTNTPSRLVSLGSHTFQPADAPDFRLVFSTEGDRARAVTVTGPGLTLRGVRDGEAADPSQGGALYEAVMRADSALFDASYAACDTARVNALLTDDVEFYHDLTGARRGAEVRADFAHLAQNCPRAKGVRRQLVPGSVHVYALPGFGAVEMGEHRFVERGASAVVAARFVHVWRETKDGWRAARLVSFDHHTSPLP